LLVIRLARTGKKKQAYFRIVVAEKQRAVGAKFIEILGNYNPHARELKLDQEKLAEYLKNGAQPSNTLAKILKKEGIKMPDWVNVVVRNRPSKQVVEEKTEEKKPAESTTEVATEAVESKEESADEVAVEEDKKEEEATTDETKEEVKEESKEVESVDAETEGKA
jgi:small subunit ribosomal protein S16